MTDIDRFSVFSVRFGSSRFALSRGRVNSSEGVSAVRYSVVLNELLRRFTFDHRRNLSSMFDAPLERWVWVLLAIPLMSAGRDMS